MFDVRQLESGDFSFSGRLDASQTDKADRVLKSITKSAILDFQELDYISSAGLGILLACQKRLKSTGNGLTLRNLNNYIKDIFKFTGFDKIFEIQ
jgi:anti-sigma B factor antagonist